VSRFYEFDSEDEAYEAVRLMLDGPDDWRQLDGSAT
jgi:hypothetical protein